MYFSISNYFCNYSGSNAVIKYLLEGSDTSAVLAKAVNGSTPAHYAAISGQLASLKLLLECGGELRNDVAVEKDSQGLTILHLASLKGDERVSLVSTINSNVVLLLIGCGVFTEAV